MNTTFVATTNFLIMTELKYINRAHAKRATKLSYLGGVALSSKIAKSEIMNTLTYVLYLAPADLSGFNVCPKSTPECRELCLNESGHNRIDIHKNVINHARIEKTKLFYNNRTFFMQWLHDEIVAYKKLAYKKGYAFSVRINGTSDITPEAFKLGKFSILTLCPNIQFYDYTKVLNRSKLLSKYENYHLTFSYSGKNWHECEIALKNNMNVAVVFEKHIPKKFKGITVINGDVTDLRYTDKKNVIVGLKYKKVRNNKNMINSKFVIKTLDKDCEY
jgi:hypothetical protein